MTISSHQMLSLLYRPCEKKVCERRARRATMAANTFRKARLPMPRAGLASALPRQEPVMKRRSLLAFTATAALIAVAALAVQQRGGNLLLLEWAHKAPAETPPTAVLLEMGLKDLKATDWSGKVTVAGAKVVHREGYRFRTDDKLVEPNAWEASSHRGLRVPAKNPAVAKMEPIATVGVVLHLADLKDDAALTIEPKEAGRAKQTVALKDVLAGKTHKLWDGAAAVRLVSTAMPITAGSKNED